MYNVFIMKYLIKEYYFKLIIAIIIIIVAILYFRSETVSKNYILNQDCGREAIAFARNNSSEYTKWSVLQSKYNLKKNACFAEFSYPSLNDLSFAIYDLTHVKEVAFKPTFGSSGEDIIFVEMAKEYNKNKDDIFGVDNINKQ